MMILSRLAQVQKFWQAWSMNHCVRGCGVSLLCTEVTPGLVKVSLRSIPDEHGCPILDVAEFAAQFGGGGHRMAAGCRIPGDLSTAMGTIRDALMSTIS